MKNTVPLLRRMFPGLLAFLLLAGLGAAAKILSAAENPRKAIKEDLKKRSEWFLAPRRQGLNGRNPAELLLKALQLTKVRVPLGGLTLAERWAPAGPQPLNGPPAYSGRGSAVAVDLGNDPTGNTVYYGAASGGVWLSKNALGASPSFVPISDQTQCLAVGAIALDSSVKPPVIYVGSGEATNGGDSYYGVGVFKSTDNGGSWSLVSSANQGAIPFLGSSFSKILVDPDPTVLLAGTVQGSYVSNPSPDGVNSLNPLQINLGIFRSTDSGASWTQVPGPTAGQPVNDLVYDPARATYYASVFGLGFYRSQNQGVTWGPLASPFAGGLAVNATNFQRANLAIRNGTLYAVIQGINADNQPAPSQPSAQDTGLVQSTDGGGSWTPIAIPDLEWATNYNLCIAAPPGTQGLVLGGVPLYGTSQVNGMATQWTGLGMPHTDQHAVGVVTSTIWYVACDGGLFSTTDSGQDWNNLNATLNTIQFYSVSPDSRNPGGLVGGTQDNGTGATTGNKAWQSVHGDDGFWTAADPLNGGQYYAEDSDGATIYRVDSSGTENAVFGYPQAWFPFELIPQVPASMIAGNNDIWMGPSNPSSPGAGWHSISPQFGFDTLGYLAPAPGDPNVIYAQNRFFIEKTSNAMSASPSWIETNLFHDGLNLGHLAVSPTDANRVYVVKDGFIDGQKIFESADGGVSWTNISGNLPNAPLNWITIDPLVPNNIYLASDVGVFLATDGGAGGGSENWQWVGAGLPDAPVLQVKLTSTFPRQLVAATFGRGAWTFKIQDCLPTAERWQEATPWYIGGPRELMGTAVYQDRMWTIGGRSPLGDGGDCDFSSDGVTWTSATPFSPMGTREGQVLLAYDPGDGKGERLWAIGGVSWLGNEFTGSPSQAFNDVWTSFDGGNWTKVTDNGRFPAGVPYVGAVFNGKMWLIGGGTSTTPNRVWSSADGKTWTPVNYIAGATNAQAAVVFNGRLFVMENGDRSTPAFGNWSYSSADGKIWQQVGENDDATLLGSRSGFSLLSAWGKLWVIGGNRLGATPGGDKLMNDAWSSADGAHWTKATGDGGFFPRQNAGSFAFMGQLWILAGLSDPANSPSNGFGMIGDVWSTDCPTGPVFLRPGSVTGNVLGNVLQAGTGATGFKIVLTNRQPAPLGLNGIEARYWFQSDCPGSPLVSAQLGKPAGRERSGVLKASSGFLSPGGPLRYLSFKFGGGSLPAGQSVTLQASARFTGGGPKGCAFAPVAGGPSLTVYFQGRLVSGREPGAAALK